MGDRVPGKAAEALMPWLAVRSPEDGRVYGALDRRGHAVRALSAALDACPVLGLDANELARVYVDHANSCPHVAWRGDRSKPCTCGGGEIEAKLSAALRPVEREP